MSSRTNSIIFIDVGHVWPAEYLGTNVTFLPVAYLGTKSHVLAGGILEDQRHVVAGGILDKVNILAGELGTNGTNFTI